MARCFYTLSAWLVLSRTGVVVKAHMELSQPYAVYSKSDAQTQESNKDYSMTAPLAKTGDDWPAKKRCTSEILSALEPVATLVSGADFEWNLAGTAVHNGGSCQVAISYDSCETMAVLASWIGGCPLSLPYTFKVPELPGADRAFFIWQWSNKSGNRELYSNAAVVAVQGTATEFVGPAPFRANTFGDKVCENPETIDVVYPAPGDQVFYGGDYSESDPPTATFSCAEWDNLQTVTVKNSGGGGGPTGVSTKDGDKDDSKDTTSTPTKTSGGTDATPAPGGGGGDGTTSSPGSSGNGTGKSSANVDSPAATGTSKPNQTGSGGTAEIGGSSGGSGSSPTTTASSSANSENFIKFAIAVAAVLALGGVAVCFFKRRSTSDDYSRPDSDSEDYYGPDSEDESSSDYRPEKREHRHGHGDRDRSRGHGHTRRSSHGHRR